MWSVVAARAQIVGRVLPADVSSKNLGSGAAKLVAVLLGVEAPQDANVPTTARLKYNKAFMALGVHTQLLVMLEELKKLAQSKPLDMSPSSC